MKILRYIILPILLMVSLFGDNSLTKEEKKWIKNNTIKVGISPWYPITKYDKKHQKPIGVGIDIFNIIIKNLNLKVKYVPDQWSILLDKFRNHKIDLLPTTYYTKERATFGNYTTAYMEIKEHLYVRENSKITSFKDLKGKTIAMVKKYGTIDKIREKFPQIKILEVDSLEETVGMVLNGKADALFNTQFSIETFLRKNFITGIKPIYQTDFKPSTLHYFTNMKKPILNSIMQKGVDSLTDEQKDIVISKWINKEINNLHLDFLTKKDKKYLKENKIIKMCNNPNWEPIEFAKDGDMSRMSGIAIDTLKLLEKKLNVAFVNVPTKDWSESQQFLKEKKCDILPAAIKTKKREEYAIFTDPYLVYKLAIITKNDKPFVNSIDDILDKTIARKQNSGLIQKIKSKYPYVKIVETKDYLESLQKVSNGDVYCTIATLPVASYYITQFALNNLQIAGYTNMKYRLSIAVRDDKPQLAKILDKTLKTITQKEHSAIYNRWANIHIKENFSYKYIWETLFILFVVILLFAYKQYLLKKSINEFDEMINATMEGILIFKNGKCIDLNQSTLDIFGYDHKDELIGKEPFDFIDKDYVDLMKNELKKDNAEAYEAVMLKKDGTKFYALLRGHNLKNRGVRLSSVIDITLLKEQERLISEQSKMVQMGEMIGNIAHQWRQPLSVISTSSSAMQLEKEFNTLTDEKFDTYTNAILQNTEFLSNTIDTFRDYIKEKPELKEVILQDRINGALEIIGASIKNHHIKLINNVNSVEPIKITLVVGELSQVIINLINNSKDAIIEKNIEDGYIKIDLKVTNNSTIITVTDNAGGIREDIISKIFNPYFTTKHQSQGTGLGLHMSKEIIEKHLNGKLSAKNSKDGAIFTIELPLS